MEPVFNLIVQWQRYITLLLQEGYVDEQFIQLKRLQDENNPDFVLEVVNLFFEDARKILTNIADAIEEKVVDFKVLDTCIHQFKGSSASAGAVRVTKLCIEFRNFCEAKNVEGCVTCLHRIQQECTLWKQKLEEMFSLERQILAAGGTLPKI